MDFAAVRLVVMVALTSVGLFLFAGSLGAGSRTLLIEGSALLLAAVTSALIPTPRRFRKGTTAVRILGTNWIARCREQVRAGRVRVARRLGERAANRLFAGAVSDLGQRFALRDQAVDEVSKRIATDPQILFAEIEAQIWAIAETVLLLALTLVITMPSVITVILTFGTVAVRELWGRPTVGGWWHWHAAVAASRLDLPDLIIAIVFAVLVVTGAVVTSVRMSFRLVGQLRKLRRDLDDSVEHELRDALQDVINAQPAPTFHRRFATGLSVFAAERLITRNELQKVRDLVTELHKGSIGIVGQRGVGKSTMLSSLVNEHSGVARSLRFSVAAPMRYDGREFVLHLYGQLCAAVVRYADQHIGRPARRTIVMRLAAPVRRALRALALVGAFVAVIGATSSRLREVLATYLPVPQRPAGFLLVALILLLVSRALHEPSHRPAHRITKEADQRLRHIRYLESTTSEGHGGFGYAGMDLGRTRSRSLTEQPTTLPDLITEYAEFLTRVRNWLDVHARHSGPIVIGIDEIDRIIDPDQVIAFLDDLRAVLAVGDCIYVVSVSDEAIERVARRGSPIQAALNNTFDDVVSVSRLDLTDSVGLLRARLTGVPDRFFVLCHCLAGGMPRELIRTARNMFELRREVQDPPMLSVLAQKLVAARIQQLADRAVEDGTPWRRVLDRIRPDMRGRRICRLAYRTMMPCDGDTAWRLGLLLYYGTILELFQTRQDRVDRWVRRNATTGVDQPARFARTLDQLCDVRAQLDADPREAIGWLLRIRARLRLAPLGELPPIAGTPR